MQSEYLPTSRHATNNVAHKKKPSFTQTARGARKAFASSQQAVHASGWMLSLHLAKHDGASLAD